MKQTVSGLLIDIDGVLCVDDTLLPGVASSLQWLRAEQIPFRFITNTTRFSRRALREKLNGLGVQATEPEIFSACAVAARWLAEQKLSRLHLLLPQQAMADFSNFDCSSKKPDAVVVGDLGDAFTFERLNTAFRFLKNGARLIALQKNRFWMTRNSLTLDVGAFVAALEYAAETEATLIGKPNSAYFQMAVTDMGLQAENVMMIGDDLFSDISGGKMAGLQTALVRTGKFQQEQLEIAKLQPTYILDSIAELPTLTNVIKRTPN